MSRSITLGQYFPGNTFFHRLDPRAKLASLVVLVVGIFAVPDFRGLLVLLGLALCCLSWSRVSYRQMLKGLRPIMIIVLLTLLLHVFFTDGGLVLWRWAGFTIESDGLYLGIFTALRLVTLIFFTMLLTLTTTPLALTGAMEFFLGPLKKFRLPVSEMSMIVMIALRFIPTLMEESNRIVKAQMARGADLGEGNLLRRAKALVPVMVPLFISAFRRAEELSVAMEARCFRPGAPRTSLKQRHAGAGDYLSVAVSGLIVMVVVFW